MPLWEIQRLDRRHDRTTFDCGHRLLNDWLRHRAGQFDRKDLARTFVASRPNETIVVGYYALANHRVAFETLPTSESKGLPSMDVPVVLLGRLAVDRTAQGHGLGAFLLIDALRRAQRIAEHTGVRAVEVDAIDQAACTFYKKFGFVSLVDNPQHMFLSMQCIRQLGLPPI